VSGTAPAPSHQPRLLLLGTLNSPHIEHLAVAMRERGHEVAVAGDISSRLPPCALPAAGLRAHEIRGRNVAAVRRVVRQVRPDVVHANWLPGMAFMAALVRARPLVAMAWGSDVHGADRRRLWQSRYTLRRADVAMADSGDMVERLIQLGADRQRTYVMRWGVDLKVFAPPADRTEAKRMVDLPDSPTIISPRGLSPVYNAGAILDAFDELRSEMPSAVLLLKHMGVAEPELGGRVLPGGVRLVGHVPYHRMAAYFQAADACVSVPSSDSSPRSVWEAMACGCPCILSDLRWTRELIEDGRDALLVAPQAADIASALRQVLTAPELADRVRARARALVEAHHDRDAEMDKLSHLYGRVAGGAAPNPSGALPRSPVAAK